MCFSLYSNILCIFLICIFRISVYLLLRLFYPPLRFGNNLIIFISFAFYRNQLFPYHPIFHTCFHSTLTLLSNTCFHTYFYFLVHISFYRLVLTWLSSSQVSYYDCLLFLSAILRFLYPVLQFFADLYIHHCFPSLGDLILSIICLCNFLTDRCRIVWSLKLFARFNIRAMADNI